MTRQVDRIDSCCGLWFVGLVFLLCRDVVYFKRVVVQRDEHLNELCVNHSDLMPASENTHMYPALRRNLRIDKVERANLA